MCITMTTSLTIEPIISFRGYYNFLSNFYRHIFIYDGWTWQTAEHAYQAMKTLDQGERLKVWESPAPGLAKRLGRRVTLREDWEQVKLEVMKEILVRKFLGELAYKLLETGGRELIEGNTWGDTYWGECQEVGENHLGKLLMQVREELRAGTEAESLPIDTQH